jgi:diaminobutyrate-2-oxoglutarate transaminase
MNPPDRFGAAALGDEAERDAGRRPPNNMDVFVGLESNVRNYSRTFPVVFTSARGARMWDEAGRSYIDFLSVAGALNYGHNNPLLKQSLQDYLACDGVIQSLDLATGAKRDFIEAFERLILRPRGLSYRLQFTGPTGAHSVEAALRLARKVKKRNGLIAFTNAFHGVTQGALSVTANRHYRAGTERGSDVAFVAYDGYLNGFDSLADLEKRIGDPGSGLDAPAAFIVETVQGEGGINVASARWLQALAALAKSCGSVLIVDEIQVGCGRAGSFFSFERAGIVPDIVTLSKSLSGFGFPMALTLIRPEFDIWKPGEHSGTFRGNNLAFVTARAALEHYWRDDAFMSQVRRKAVYLRDRLDGVAEEVNRSRASLPPLAVRGCGLIQGIDCLNQPMAAAVVSQAFADGLIVETCGSHDQVVKCLPPLTIGLDDLEAGLDILCSAVKAVSSAAPS